MELLIVGLTIVGLILMVFGLGAVSGWLWAVKSLKVKPPAWITAVTAAAAATSAAAFALQGDWLSALGFVLMFGTIVIGQQRMWPFRRSGGEAS